MPYKDKKKQIEYQKKWYQKNKSKKDLQNKIWRLKNPLKCKKISKDSYLKMLKEEPWKQHFKSAHQRCVNVNRTGYKYYGGKGIKFKLSIEEIKFLWFRDKAYNLKRPSIDRKDNDGNYELSNCRFIELLDNIYNPNIKRDEKGRFKS